jgi:hypothetical protein
MFDARNGLSAEVLDELRSARQVMLALKDQQTAVLGYWLADDERLHAVVLPARVHRTAGCRFEDEQPLVIAAPEQDALWRGAARYLRPHQRIQVEWSLGWGGVNLSVEPPEHRLINIGPGGAQSTTLQLGRTVGPRIRRGQSTFRPYGQPG